MAHEPGLTDIEAAPAQPVFLPDLCGFTALFVVVVVSELVALIMVVGASGFGPGFFDELALLSLYTQWLGLSAAAALCLARRWLNGLDERAIAVLSYLLVLLVIWAVAELAWWVVNPLIGAGALTRLSRGDLILRTVLIGGVVAALMLRYFYVQFHYRHRLASEAQARLEALQARIRPHFFFNCMNTIAALTRTEPALAERAVEDLADLFRASLTDARAPVAVSEEIAFVERYLGIRARLRRRANRLGQQRGRRTRTAQRGRQRRFRRRRRCAARRRRGRRLGVGGLLRHAVGAVLGARAAARQRVHRARRGRRPLGADRSRRRAGARIVRAGLGRAQKVDEDLRLANVGLRELRNVGAELLPPLVELRACRVQAQAFARKLGMSFTMCMPFRITCKLANAEYLCRTTQFQPGGPRSMPRSPPPSDVTWTTKTTSSPIMR